MQAEYESVLADLFCIDELASSREIRMARFQLNLLIDTRICWDLTSILKPAAAPRCLCLSAELLGCLAVLHASSAARRDRLGLLLAQVGLHQLFPGVLVGRVRSVCCPGFLLRGCSLLWGSCVVEIVGRTAALR